MIKPLKHQPLAAPEFQGGGKSHAQWLTEKYKQSAKKKEDGNQAATIGGAADAETSKPKK